MSIPVDVTPVVDEHLDPVRYRAVQEIGRLLMVEQAARRLFDHQSDEGCWLEAYAELARLAGIERPAVPPLPTSGKLVAVRLAYEVERLRAQAEADRLAIHELRNRIHDAELRIQLARCQPEGAEVRGERG
jgi:hypothetical protein